MDKKIFLKFPKEAAELKELHSLLFKTTILHSVTRTTMWYFAALAGLNAGFRYDNIHIFICLVGAIWAARQASNFANIRFETGRKIDQIMHNLENER